MLCICAVRVAYLCMCVRACVCVCRYRLSRSFLRRGVGASPILQAMTIVASWAVLDRRRTRAISMYLADDRDHFLQKLSHGGRRLAKEQRRRELLRLARRAFSLESDDVKRLCFGKG